MKQFIAVISAFVLLFACTPKENDSEDVSTPGDDAAVTAVTVEANHISVISAVLTGKVNLGSTVATDIKIGFQYSKSAGIIPTNSTTVDAEDADANYNYTTTITGLDPDTKYYFRSFVRQNGQDTYGNTKEFTTKNVTSLLETKDASDIEATQATLNARLDLTDVQYKSLAYGFLWGTSEATLNTDFKCTEISNNSISAALANLSHKTQYWYKAYVTLDGQTFNGEMKTFTTSDRPVEIAITGEATDIGDKSVTLSGWSNQEGSAGVSVVFGIEYSATDLTTAATTVNVSEKDGENKYSCHITGLKYNTLYYYRAFTLYDGVRTYGEVKTFKTLYFPVESISLNKTAVVIYSGGTETLTAKFNPSTASNKAVTWRSSNTSVATVSYGAVTGKARGTATITVTANDNSSVQASCEVEVKQNVTFMSLDKPELRLIIGEKTTLSVTSIQPDNANDKSYTWSSSNDAIVSVDSDGNVLAKARGTATITVTANDPGGSCSNCFVVVLFPEPLSAIDLGLSVKWANEDIGASAPEQRGDYYSWGETLPKPDYSWSTYRFGTNSSGPFSKYNSVDNKTVLDPEDDVAHVKLGGTWRMPTEEEWSALKTKCTWTWTKQNDVSGMLVTASNGNSIFFPSTLYWTSSLYTESNYLQYARYVGFNSNGFRPYIISERCNGLSVRPVLE